MGECIVINFLTKWPLSGQAALGSDICCILLPLNVVVQSCMLERKEIGTCLLCAILAAQH